jgi:hypothetical protein
VTEVETLSLKSLLFGGGKALSCEGEGEGSLAEVRQQLASQLPNLDWADASKAIDDKVDSVLSFPINGMLVGAWAKYKALHKYCDAEIYPPGKTVLLSLLKHQIEAAFAPSVVIQVAGIDIAGLLLPIGLSLEVEGIVLEIESGKIMALKAGSLQGFGTVEFRLNMLRPKLLTKQLFEPIERKTAKVDLRAAIPFGAGIPIRPVTDDR